MKKFLFLAVVFMFSACSKKENPTGPGESLPPMVPLTVGNRWEYIDSTFSRKGDLLSVDSSFLGITGKTTIQYQTESHEVYYWNWLVDTTKQPSSYFWLTANESDGVYCYGGVTDQGMYVVARSLEEKYPANAGETWQRVDIGTNGNSFFIRDTTTFTLESKNAIFPTSAGNLNCYVYRYKQDTVSYSLFYSVGVGYVGMVGVVNNVIMEKKILRSYHLQTAAAQESVGVGGTNAGICFPRDALKTGKVVTRSRNLRYGFYGIR